MPLSLLRFRGKIKPLPYAAWSLAVFFSQHLVVAAMFYALRRPMVLDGWFWIAPLRPLTKLEPPLPGAILMLALAYLLIVAWVLAALAFRRAADAAISAWITAYAIAPLAQIPVVLFLAVLPSRAETELAAPAEFAARTERADFAAAVEGVLAGIALTLFAVAVGALVFGTYGFGMFVVSPFMVGAMTAFFANRRAALDNGTTAKLVLFATVLGGAALIVAALEGAVCLVLAAPLGIGLALVGGLFGRAIALSTKRSPTQTLSGVALLPLIFALEAVLPPLTRFETIERVLVDAPPAAVWDAIVRMAPIDAPPALPFRLGVAYPLGGEIVGEGVGAERRGAFSTGTAIERVTQWETARKLAFAVVNDVPAMREFSPYPHLHTPHVIGYFRTTFTSFELVPHGQGRTEIVEHTAHELRLDPVFYWLPLARWIVHENNTRVLAHIKRQAEARPAAGD